MSKQTVLDLLEVTMDHSRDNMLESFGIALDDEGTEQLAKLIKKADMYIRVAPTKSQALEEIVKGEVFNEEDTRVITLFFFIAGAKSLIHMVSQ